MTDDDQFLGKLTRFTPGPVGLDRDELMFLAGRASARTPWGWKLAVLLLGVAQVVALAMLMRPTPAPAPLPLSPAFVEPPAVPLPSEPANPVLTARLTGELPPLRSGVSEGVPSHAIWTARTRAVDF